MERQPHRAAVGADPLGVADSGARSVLVAGRVCLVEGTLVPTVPWRPRSDLASGTQRRHGVHG